MPPRQFAPRAKMYFAISDKKDLLFIKETLQSIKDDTLMIKSFNSYEFQDKTYVNLYLTNIIFNQKGFDDITKDLNGQFNKTFIYTYKNSNNEVVFKTAFDKNVKCDSIIQTYKPKLFTQIDNDKLDVYIELLKGYKKKYKTIKSFNGYKYQNKQYLNIHLFDDTDIDSIEAFDEMTGKLNKLFEEDLRYKYKNSMNELLFTSLFQRATFFEDED
jgi:hypothetical protein